MLRARYLSVRTTDADTQAAIALLERAVALDPGFARAYADLAAAYVTRLTFVTPEETGDLEQKAFAAAEKALLLDPNLAEAYLARGDLLWTHSHHFAHERAVQEFRRAVGLNPNSDQGPSGASRVCTSMWAFSRRPSSTRPSRSRINPSNAQALNSRAQALLWMGKDEEALADTLEHSRTRPAGTRRGEHRVRSPSVGQTRGSVGPTAAGLTQIPERPERRACPASRRCYWLSPSPLKARELIEKVAKRKAVNPSHHAAYFAACAWARMGRAQEAVQWLREAAETGFPCYALFARDPNLDPIRRTRVSRRFSRTCRNSQSLCGRRCSVASN